MIKVDFERVTLRGQIFAADRELSLSYAFLVNGDMAEMYLHQEQVAAEIELGRLVRRYEEQYRQNPFTGESVEP